MTAERRIEAFLTLSDRGLKSAEILFRHDQLEDATLFVQQVVERVARALLTHSGVAFGTSHNLGQMASALPEPHPFRERIRAFDDLSSAVTAFRYPTSSGRQQRSPDAANLARKIQDAAQLLQDAKDYIRGS